MASGIFHHLQCSAGWTGISIKLLILLMELVVKEVLLSCEVGCRENEGGSAAAVWLGREMGAVGLGRGTV